MKKGLITALGTIALAIAGNGFALAPIIDGVPDVIIGDAEDNVGQSVDMNFFRLNNALNLMTYVNPTDSTDPGELIFAFTEEGTGETLDVTGGSNPEITEVTNSTAAPSLWDKKFTNALSGSFMLSFRNIALSPRTGTTPFAEPAQAEYSRNVTLFLGDEADNVDTDDIVVYTKDDQNDALSGTASPNYTTIFTQSAFPGTAGSQYAWAFTQFAFNSYSNCTSSTGTGTTFLGIQSGASAAAGGAFFARWWMPGTGTYPLLTSPIAHVDGNIVYCAKMRLSVEGTPGGVKAYAPDIRFGVENTGQNLITTNLIYSQNDGTATTADQVNPQIPGAGEARDYRFYWSPVAPETDAVANAGGLDWRRWRLFFDIVDANAATGTQDAGTWKVNYVEVGYVNRPADIAPVAGSSTNFRITDLTATNGWSLDTGFSKNSSVNQNSPAAGQITFNINAASANASTCAIWQRLTTAPWIAGKVLRVTARLSCPTTTHRTNFAMARVRHQGILPWVAQVFTIRREPGFAPLAPAAPYLPQTIANAPTGTPYECYMPSYGGPNAFIAGLANGSYFIVGLDHVLQSTADPALQWTVHELLYETLDEATLLMP
jgi:hypothetical protein